ncbi:MAG: Acetyl/propionyl CoA carboxylase alpha subunit [Cyanobacteria bacterium RYN_339]|nr:Acetyl/propionyl CoA carboxylase alpha subunit [Cyanobacteria bacterium RYN_339]
MHKVLIANRGEIAARLILACREHNLLAVAVYATPDADAPYVALADEAYELPGDTPTATYLDAAALLAVATASGADAVHPGYGFLSEDAGFAEAVGAAGLTWIGPPAALIALMGDKWRAREAAAAAGLPVLAGGPVDQLPTQYPIMIKATGGGGGLGLRRVDRAEDFEAAVAAAGAQAAQAFRANPGLYWEAFLPGARHVEVQLVSERAMGVRECSVQRRFQKLVEECPAPVDVAALAEQLARAVGYRSLGTVEFLWTVDGGPVFLEMNTRLQVEHPVTELVYGVDLPGLQLAIAAGQALPSWEPRGHAIEARIYAEDPTTGAPAAGRIDHLRWPSGPWIRVDAGVNEGQELPTGFDALLAKVIAWGPTREMARRRLLLALDRTEIVGTLVTNLAHLRAVVGSAAFVAGEVDTQTVAVPLAGPSLAEAERAVAACTTTGLVEAATGHNWARRAWR